MKLIRKLYKKKDNQAIYAIQLKLEMQEFNYLKWDAEQLCKKGDWIVKNGSDIYTIDQTEFKRTYKRISESRYIKTTVVWACIASTNGFISTLEGKTHYLKGDYLIANEENGQYDYAISKIKFEKTYYECNLSETT